MKRVARLIVRDLDTGRIAEALEQAPRRDWRPLAELIFWVEEVSEQIAKDIVLDVDVSLLDDQANGVWDTFPHEHKVLLGALAQGPDREPARSWIDSHADELERLDPVMALVSPHAVLKALSNGCAFDLGIRDGLGWSTAAAALFELHNVDDAQAVKVLRENAPGITAGLELPQADKCQGLLEFLRVAEEIDSDVLQSAVAALDPATIEDHWIARMRGRTNERRSVAKLLRICERGPRELKSMAARMKKQFPSLQEGGSLDSQDE